MTAPERVTGTLTDMPVDDVGQDQVPPVPLVDTPAAGCSVSSPIDHDLEREEPWTPVPLSQLKADGPMPWVWHGYIAPGMVTLLSAAPKAGKTTLLSHVVRAMGAGADSGLGTIKAGMALVVSEEPKRVWIRRQGALGFGDHVDVLLRPFKGKPSSPMQKSS